jgi:DNA helicase-2/ATP-dependent DNA helicase PcrA
MSGLRTVQLSAKQRAAADAFLDAFNINWMDMAPKEVAQNLLEHSGYLQMWRDSKDSDSAERLDNVRELITDVIAKYTTLPEFLEQAALMMTDDDEDDNIGADKNAVSIMTIHAAKGLEFDNVYLPAWEEGIFPNEKSVGEGGIEEERRLAYVAITRARKRAVISNAMTRMIFGSRQYNSPSRFITEMDNRFLDFQGGIQPQRTSYSSYTAPRRVTPRTVPTTMVGKLVSHAELGHGTVIAENGDVLTVAFGKHGMKNVMKSFVTIL